MELVLRGLRESGGRDGSCQMVNRQESGKMGEDADDGF